MLRYALVWIDDRAGYGGARMVALAPIEAILYYEAFADRVAVTRITSLRRAKSREISHYVKSIQGNQHVNAVT